MTPRYALFGCNPLAIEVAWSLTMVRQPFVLLDRDKVLVDLAREEGLSAEHVDYTEDEALRAVGIGSHIEGVFCRRRCRGAAQHNRNPFVDQPDLVGRIDDF